jgi:hypothetical protein
MHRLDIIVAHGASNANVQTASDLYVPSEEIKLHCLMLPVSKKELTGI